jgi:hypothetical protein
VKWLRWRSSGSLKSEAQISPRKLVFEWSLEERDWELKRVCQSVCNVKWVASRARDVWGAFYSPAREYSRWGVRNPDMSRSGAGHIRPTSLEPSLGTGYVLSKTKSLRNWVRSHISGLEAEHVWQMPLESGLEAEYAWLTQEKAETPDMAGLGVGHVRPESLESG